MKNIHLEIIHGLQYSTIYANLFSLSHNDIPRRRFEKYLSEGTRKHENIWQKSQVRFKEPHAKLKGCFKSQVLVGTANAQQPHDCRTARFV